MVGYVKPFAKSIFSRYSGQLQLPGALVAGHVTQVSPEALKFYGPYSSFDWQMQQRVLLAKDQAGIETTRQRIETEVSQGFEPVARGCSIRSKLLQWLTVKIAVKFLARMYSKA